MIQIRDVKIKIQKYRKHLNVQNTIFGKNRKKISAYSS